MRNDGGKMTSRVAVRNGYCEGAKNAVFLQKTSLFFSMFLYDLADRPRSFDSCLSVSPVAYA